MLTQVGSGSVLGIDQILGWQDQNLMSIHGIAFTSKDGVLADWQISTIQGPMQLVLSLYQNLK